MRSAIVAAAALAALAAEARAADYSREAEGIAREIVEIHPRGPEIAAAPDFIAARAALMSVAADADLPHYAAALGRMFHAANDGHTAVIPTYSENPLYTHRYPLKLKRFEDGLYVVAAKGDAEKLLGGRITAIGGRKIDALLRDFVATQSSGNRAWPANRTPHGVTYPGTLIGLDAATVADAPVDFEAVVGGRKLRAALVAAAGGHEGLKELGRAKAPLESPGGGFANHVAEIDDGRALALVVGAMEDSEGKSFEQFTAEVFAALGSTKASRVIVDLRNNGGGNNMLCEPLRRMLVKSRFNHVGGIYILASPGTFSAAQNFATRLERETDALFVGEPTGGSPNHFGDAKFATAPASGLPYIISTLRWQDSTPFDERPWILPDIPAPPAFADFLAGRDAALAAALAHRAEPVADDWRTRVVQPWKRPSQEAAWRFFYESK